MRKITHIGIVVCMVLNLYMANAQEYTRDISFISSGGTAFACRQNNQKWIFCNTDTARCAQFVQVDTSSSSVPRLSIADLHVLNDAKAEDSKVYFCGEADVNNASKAVFGYFNENGFPSVPVEYVSYSALNQILRIEPFFDGQNRHVILIGKDNNNDYCLVDAFHDPAYGTGWSSRKGSDNAGMVYDDIAATSEHVIVSAREIGTNNGYIYIFDKPQYTGTIFSAAQSYQFKLATNVHSPIFLSMAGGDKYMAVYSASADGTAVVVAEFNNSAFLAGGMFDYSHRMPAGAFLAIKEVNYDNLSQSVDILVWENIYGATGSTIWNVNHSQLVSGNSLQGHRFAGDNITSVARTVVSSANVITAGYSSSSHMRAIRFVDNVWSGCSSHPSQGILSIYNGTINEDPTFISISIPKSQDTFQTTTGVIGVSTYCTH